MKNIRVVFLSLSFALLLCVFQQQFLLPVLAAPSSPVYPGGFPIGISIDVNGLLIDELCGVDTEYGTAYVEGLKVGDIIKSVNGAQVTCIEDLSTRLAASNGEAVKLDIVRKGKDIEIEVKPMKENISQKLRLGIMVKEKIMGVGTVTYIDKHGNFGALGHAIYEAKTGVRIPFVSGNAYKCNIIGIKKGKRGVPGEVKAAVLTGNKIGTLKDNNEYGIYGKLDNFTPDTEPLNAGGRAAIRLGAAKILLTTDNKPEYYDIEIIKCAKQSKRSPKGIVFRVTDKRLIEQASGIVQGMSGSPIIQNGNLVGAVTHVFLNDPTKGYGIYLDYMD